MPRNRHSYRRRRSEDSSDENEDNFRHDRFRSERYPESNYNSKQRYDNRDSQRDRKRHRRRSKSRSRSPHYRSRSPRSSSRSSKKEHKNSSSSDIRLKKNVENVPKKNSVESITNDVPAKPKQKTNLSDLLKRFDESTKKSETANESSNSCSTLNTDSSKSFSNDKEELLPDNHVAVGPVLPQLIQRSLSNEAVEESQQENGSRETCVPVGPSLPPYLQNSSSEDNATEKECKVVDVSVMEDQSPQNNTSSTVGSSVSPDIQIPVIQLPDSSIGPALPPHLQNSGSDNNGKTSDKNEPEYYGPSLPPSLKGDVKKIIGPVLPPDCKMEVENIQEECEEEEEEEENDDDFVGPVPEDSKERSSMVQQQLDLRAMELKIKMLEGENEGSDIKKRESWMLELPATRAASLGLGPRTFRTREGPDMSDRSCWTDTPADKLQKLMKEGEDVVKSGKDELRRASLSERDKTMEELTKERSSDKPLSLLEIHQQNMRKKKMKEEQEGKKPERRPFDRNIDLQVNRFDEAQRKTIFKKAQLLNSRFSQGESKYL